MIYELVTGIHPFAGKEEFEIRESLSNPNLFQLPKHCSSDLASFISRSLEIDPQKRASSIELIGHSWILKNISPQTSIRGWLEDISTNVIPLIKQKN